MTEHSISKQNTATEAFLAIVIPAYKSTFLREALYSISQQTDQRFYVYVGDDASPADLKIICDEFREQLPLTYHRFEKNMGKESLTNHWNRCVQMSSEPWTWLFCDDDQMEPECVHFFYKALNETKQQFELYRFNTFAIDQHSKITRKNPMHPTFESGISFAYNRFLRKRESYVTEYIFKRTTFDNHQGFVPFPAAWCSDDATWITFAEKKGIYTITGPSIYWRHSDENIGGNNISFNKEKFRAAAQYIDWFFDKYDQSIKQRECEISRAQLMASTKKWLLHQTKNLPPYGPLFCFFLPVWPKSFGWFSRIPGRLQLLYFDLIFYTWKLIRFTKRLTGLPTSHKKN